MDKKTDQTFFKVISVDGRQPIEYEDKQMNIHYRYCTICNKLDIEEATEEEVLAAIL